LSIEGRYKELKYMKDFIIMDRVFFSYGNREILSNVHLTLEAGSSYALIGKSGSGKSTILNLIAGFLKPDGGTVTVNGAEVRAPRSETAFLFQDLGLFPWQTVEDAVSMPLKIKGRTDRLEAAVMELLVEMRLEGHKDKYPQELSGGERQRVALARTLIGEPDLLLMDEPTSELDAMTKEELQGIIIREQQKRTATLLFVTHDIEEAVMLGQHILLMNVDGTVSQLDNPYYSVKNAREELGFYDQCIRLRKLLKMEM
jgi:ABC-type nitrate/sulfonate/bicarbonate transport system ATPase subunit